MNLTPHGPGFSFIDSIEVDDAGEKAIAKKWLDPKAPFFADHFPGQPLMPGVLMMEAAAQAAGVLWQHNRGGNVNEPLVLAQVGDFRFLQPVRPGATLEISVSLKRDFGSLGQFQATLKVGENIVASGTLTLSRTATAE